VEAGETEARTALRELEEETGLVAQLDGSVSATIEYPIGQACRKQVVFFPGRVEGNAVPRAGEIDRCKWVAGEELEHYLFPDTAAACKQLMVNLP
jgi:8-oxo-dGTP pyrophosphatase MutT (NUDIX family)